MDSEKQDYLDSLNAHEFSPYEIAGRTDNDSCAALSYEEAYARLRKVVIGQPLHREILYKTLVWAEDLRTLKELEDYIATLPQFSEATQPQYYLVKFLVDAGGLAEFNLDCDGRIIDEDRLSTLDEDEVDDLVFSWGYCTTEVGRDFARSMSPRTRFRSLIEAHPEWSECLEQLLSFLKEKRALSEIDTFLRSCSANAQDVGAIQAGVFVDKLEKSGVIVWQGGWQATEEVGNLFNE